MNEFFESKVVEKTGEDYKVEQTWKDWLKKTEESMEAQGDEVDTLQKSLYEVVKESVECDQYIIPENELVDVERMVKFRIKLPRDAIHQLFKVKTYSIYGIGLFTKMEGLLLSAYTRDEIGYDTCHAKGKSMDLSRFSQEIIDSHEFRLAVPALKNGLFIPKKTRLTSWIGGTYGLQYFDISKF